MPLTAADLKVPEKSPLTEADVTAFVTTANEKKWEKELAQTVLEQRHEAIVGHSTRTAAERKAAALAIKPADLKKPDGSLLTEADLADVHAFAQKHEVPLEVAQAVLEGRDATVRGHLTRMSDAHKAQVTKWAEDVKADKELGGTNYDRTLKRVKAVTDRFDAEQAVTKLMNETGFGNRVEAVRFLERIGAAIEEDTTVIGALRPPKPEAKVASAAEMWPKTAGASA